MRISPRRRRWTTLVLALLLPGSLSLALEPDEVALICNPQNTASPELAALYATTRNIPAQNVIEISLPGSEQMAGEHFDPDVVHPLRKAMLERGLRNKIKCLVTFYGVPIKLAPRKNTPEEQKELADLEGQAPDIERRITKSVTTLESVLTRYDPTFHPDGALDIVRMLRRAEAAIARGQQLLPGLDPDAREQVQAAIIANITQLGGPAALVQSTRPNMLRSLTTAPTSQPASTPEQLWDNMRDGVEKAKAEMPALLEKRYEPKSRERLRELITQNFGLIDLLRQVQIQIDYLTPEPTTSFDSELALLWYDAYTHRGMLPNPLHYASKDRDKSQAVMVMRLDGPQSGTARDIFLACKAVESRGGLAGKFAIDSRGLLATKSSGEKDAYGAYDERLRDLATLVQRNSKMPVILDTSADVFKPGSVKDVALYCGWYSVRNYVPAFTFEPGAVGFHIGSFEMLSLREPQEKGWVRGLLNDGIASTLGPVDEPYLGAFPDPMDFFPLLMSGKYSLAETYWLTLPTVSWKMSIIGDPLYAPFKTKPALKPEALPERLRPLVAPAPEPQQHLPGYQGF